MEHLIYDSELLLIQSYTTECYYLYEYMSAGISLNNLKMHRCAMVPR